MSETIRMRFKGKVEKTILKVGVFKPGPHAEYPLPASLANELIATEDPDWEKIKSEGDKPSTFKKGGK